jgi:hypothetical protein
MTLHVDFFKANFTEINDKVKANYTYSTSRNYRLMGNYLYCFPVAARHSFEAFHCISEKLRIFIECGWYLIVVSFLASLAGIAQMVVCWIVTPCTMLSLLYEGNSVSKLQIQVATYVF